MPNIDQNDDDDQKMRNITSVCSIPWWRSDNYGHDHDHIVSCGNDDEELTAINLSTTRCLDYDLASATSTYNTISRSSRYSEPARMHINEPTDHHHDVNKDIYQGSEDGKYEQRHGEKQVHHDVRTVNSMVNLPAMKIDHDLHLASTSGHLELFGHSIASTTAYPYAADSYYGKAMPAFTAPQTLVHYSQVKTYYGGVDGGGGGRMPLLLPMAEEPVYVNAKQYHGILKRRQSRAKAELQRKLIKVRKPYLHESRHLHAMRRERGCGGRFLNTKLKQPQQLDNLPASSDNKATSAASGASSVLSSEFSLYPAGSTDITADHHQRLGMKGTNSALTIK